MQRDYGDVVIEAAPGDRPPGPHDIERLLGRGKWSFPGWPHRGWLCIDVEDVGGLHETCEMCEFQEIRYVHVMYHPDVAETLRCGCICAGYMEGDYTHAEERERWFRNLARRERSWLHKGWRASHTFRNGDLRKGEHTQVSRVFVEVYPLNSLLTSWGGHVKDLVTGSSRRSKARYVSKDDVKRACLAVVRSLLRRRGNSRKR